MLPVSVVTRATSDSSTAIDRYLGSREGMVAVSYQIPVDLQRYGLDSIRLLGSEASTGQPTIGDGDAVIHWHMLWAADEASASVTVSTDGDQQRWSIAPGDTISIPPGYQLTATGGQLALAIAVAPGTSIERPPSPPTHGDDRFAGHNRCTTIPVPGRLALLRWKLTEPLELRQHHAGDLVLLTLAGRPAILTGSTVLAPRRGQAIFAPSESEPRVLPNGLTYLLVIAPAQVSAG